MEEKFYTIDQVAELLGMHHKTIRKFINEGKLRAGKVGKQWRISSHDLSVFMEDNNINLRSKDSNDKSTIEFKVGDVSVNKKICKINISSVIDIVDVDTEEYRKISNTLIAIMNSKDSKMSNSNINIKYYQDEKNLKILLWGSGEFIKEMIDFINSITENLDNYN